MFHTYGRCADYVGVFDEPGAALVIVIGVTGELDALDVVLFVELVRPFVEFLRAERFERSHF
jgi:hypothetical protein